MSAEFTIDSMSLGLLEVTRARYALVPQKEREALVGDSLAGSATADSDDQFDPDRLLVDFADKCEDWIQNVREDLLRVVTSKYRRLGTPILEDCVQDALMSLHTYMRDNGDPTAFLPMQSKWHDRSAFISSAVALRRSRFLMMNWTLCWLKTTFIILSNRPVSSKP